MFGRSRARARAAWERGGGHDKKQYKQTKGNNNKTKKKPYP